MPLINKDILNRNLLALTNSSPEAANSLTYCDTSETVTFQKTRSNHNIPVYFRNNQNKKLIHSSFDPVKEGIRLFDQYNAEGMLLILGLGGGYHIRPFLKSARISSIIIIENNTNEIRSILGNIDLSDIFLDKRVSLWISPDPEVFSAYLLRHYLPVISGNLQTITLRSRVLMDNDFYSRLTAVVKHTIDQITDDYTVQTHFGKKWFVNTLSNLKKSEKTVYSLKPISKAYITAAGPSLEKQLSELKERESDSTLIATDTSLPVLLSNAIKPDLVISIDCQHISYNHFMSGYPEDVPLILDLASPSFLTRFSRLNFFFTSDHPFSRYVSNEFRCFPKIDTSGGNVTHAALSLAELLGAREIYLLGADFSYPFGKPYARDSYIYPYFFSRTGRISGIEDKIFSFVMHNKSINKEKTSKGYRYISKPMIHYKESIEKKAAQCHSRVTGMPGDGVKLNFPISQSYKNREIHFVSAGIPYQSSRDFLIEYKNKIEALPEITVSVNEYLNSLSQKEKEVWVTILPTAAQYRKKTETGVEAIRKARLWSLELINRVLDSEEYRSVVYKA